MYKPYLNSPSGSIKNSSCLSRRHFQSMFTVITNLVNIFFPDMSVLWTCVWMWFVWTIRLVRPRPLSASLFPSNILGIGWMMFWWQRMPINSRDPGRNRIFHILRHSASYPSSTSSRLRQSEAEDSWVQGEKGKGRLFIRLAEGTLNQGCTNP